MGQSLSPQQLPPVPDAPGAHLVTTSTETRDETFERFGWRCAMCGLNLRRFHGEVDHWVPRSKWHTIEHAAGIHSMDHPTNLVAMCVECNQAKRDCMPYDILRLVDGRIASQSDLGITDRLRPGGIIDRKIAKRPRRDLMRGRPWHDEDPHDDCCAFVDAELLDSLRCIVDKIEASR